MSATEINEITSEFHSVIFKLLKICQKLEPNNINLQWLRKQLSLARDIDPLLIINKCADKIWTHREQIIDENEDFFLHNQYGQYIKNVKDNGNKSFISELVNLVKSKYQELSVTERKVLWTLTKNLLTLVAKYKKVNGDFI